MVTITGTNFTDATAVDFGTTPATSFTFNSDTSITAVSPAGTGTVDVTVIGPGGTSATSAADQFNYAPAVTGVSPAFGPGAGGTLVTITGTNFTDATAVDFGTTPATSFTFNSDTSITAVSPAGTGTVDVTVIGPGGTSAASAADQFTYAPTVSGVSPAFGPAAGGTLVTITGTNFTAATAVDFGTTPAASFTFNSDTSITAVSPAGTDTVDVTVTGPGGTSATSSADDFTYAPTVSGISPTFGPAAGGTLVTITGTGFNTATDVEFGTTPGTGGIIDSDTTITIDSPAGTGTVDVTVTSPSGTSATSPADQFTYMPAVTGISPTSGSAAGGTTVTISGIGFTGVTAVDFGTTPAASYTFNSDTSITAVSPAGTGTADVTVTTPVGTSATTSADEFTYVPAVTGISPTSGPAAGGTTVMISGAGFTGVTAVDFGTTPATSFTFNSDTSITAVSPAGTGTVDVTVTTPAGTSAMTSADEFTYVPTVTGISPTFGPAAGGTTVTIGGIGFTGVTAVDFGTTPAASFTFNSDSSITAVSPAGTSTVDVTVTGPGGTSATSSADDFTYAPTVSGISPTFGPAAGGTLVTITGTGFNTATEVKFGSTPASGGTIVSDTTITIDSPAGTGTVDVTVTSPSGTSATSPADQFSYAPTVTSISPTFGPAAGGTTVTIGGVGFTGVTAVDFGTTPATSFTFNSDSSITAVSPAGTDTVDVTVTGPGGTSATSSADDFTYAPTVSGISPTFGPAAGGTLVTITGTGFTTATEVEFGTMPASGGTIVSDTTITIDSPAGTGTVDVTVTSPSGTSATSPADQFSYAPTVAGISPTFGPAAGGTTVMISGVGFTGVTAVDFGTTPATSFTFNSDSSITAVSPAGTDTVDVTVTGPGGTSATSSADQFTYAPTVSGVSPAFGPAAGGTLVTITGTGFNTATEVEFGTTPTPGGTIVNDTTITIDSPAGTGTVDVTVTSPSGTSATSPADQFTYGPTVSGLSPSFGPSTGGTAVTITGTNFSGVSVVDFGTTPALSFSVTSTTSITAVSPPGSDSVNVTVTTPGGTSPTSSADVFGYSPTVTSVSPLSGSEFGGDVVTITGTNLANPTAVYFGTASATTLISASSTQIVVDSPAANVLGPVDVTVTTAGGTSPTSPLDTFLYVAPGAVTPRVTGISPAFGSPDGGTLVTITGRGFSPTAPMQVYFGATPATDVNFVSTTTITAVSPPGTGAVDVMVLTYAGPSLTSPADVFTYTVDGPQVTNVQRFGYHAQPTYLVISFNMSLDPSSAEDAANYRIVGSGGGRIRVKSATYNAATNAVTLVLAQRLNLRKSYTLTINGTTSSAVRSSTGLPLDGAFTGEPGSDYVTTITQSDLAGPASKRPIAAVLKAKARSLFVRAKLALHKHVK